MTPCANFSFGMLPGRSGLSTTSPLARGISSRYRYVANGPTLFSVHTKAPLTSLRAAGVMTSLRAPIPSATQLSPRYQLRSSLR